MSSTEDFNIVCTDGEYHFPEDYLRFIFQLVADLQDDTSAHMMSTSFAKAQLGTLLNFTASLNLALETKEEWRQLFDVVDYIQLTPLYEKFLIKRFLK